MQYFEAALWVVLAVEIAFTLWLAFHKEPAE